MSTIQTFAGFEWGTVHDVAAGNAGSKIFDGVTGVYGTNLDVVAGSGSAIGSYVGQVATIANKNFYWDTNTLGTGKTDLVVSLRFRFTSFPTSDNDIHSIDVAATTDRAGFFYQVSTGKLVAWITSSTQVATMSALVLNTWYTLQFKYSCGAAINTLDWAFNGTTQTQVTNNLGASTIARYALGNRSGSNGTIQLDDIAVSTTGADHPLPMYNVRLVTADTGGTTTEIGTANSTARFTTNNTIDATHNSANILAAISEVPPTLGATASGVAQRAGTTTDAVSIPMTTISLAGDTIVACRVLVCGWANGTLANNLGIRAWNGTAETVLVAGTVASLFSNSTTDPDWFAAMYAGVTNQTTLNALEIRLGYSSDISPEPGAHAVYAEILTLPASGVTANVNGIPSGEQVGAAVISPGTVTVSPSGIASSERVGSANVTPVISAAGVASGERVGSANVTPVIAPSGITSGEIVGSPTVTPGTVTVSPSGIASSEQVGAASIFSSVTITPGTIPSGEQVGAAVLSPGSVTVSPSSIASSERVGAPTISPGSVAVSPGSIPSSEVVGSPTLTSTSPGLNAGGIPSSERVGSPSVTPGAVVLQLVGIPSSERVGSASIASVTDQTLHVGGIVSAEQIGSSRLVVPSTTRGGQIFECKIDRLVITSPIDRVVFESPIDRRVVVIEM